MTTRPRLPSFSNIVEEATFKICAPVPKDGFKKIGKNGFKRLTGFECEAIYSRDASLVEGD